MKISRINALAGVCLFSLATPAFAADDNTAEIIVEARRKSESLQDVPLTVNAVTSETIAKLNIRDGKDIAAVVPGLQLAPGNGVSGAVTSLRGLNVNGNASGNNGTVEFYQNDSPMPSGVVLQSLYDIGQVEVLRGPQGTLRGRASPSGSITVTTRRPELGEWGGYAQGTVNSLDGFNIQGAVNLPVVGDAFAIRVAGVWDENELNRVHSINSDRGPKSRTKGLRVSLRLAPVDGLEVNASYNRMVRKFNIYDQVESANLAIGTPVVGTLITARDRLAVSDTPRLNRQEYEVFNWQAQWSFSGLRVNYVGNYFNQDLRGLEPLDKGNFFDSSYPGNAVAATQNLQNYVNDQHTFSNLWTNEVRLSNEERVFGMFDFIVGAFVNRFSSPTDVLAATPVFSGPVGPTTYASMNTRLTLRRGRQLERALFGNVTAHLGEDTEVSGGVRAIKYNENLNVNLGGKASSHSPIIWTAAVKHNFSDDLMVYATAGSSWRIGTGSNPIILARTVDLTTITDPFVRNLFELTPETSKSYEIGFRSSFFDKKVIFNVSAFHQDFKNYIFSGPAVYVANNLGTVAAPVYGAPARTLSSLALGVPAKVDGIEAEIAFKPSRRFDLGLNVAYAKSNIKGTVPCTPVAAGSGVPTLAQIQEGNATRQVAQCTVSQSAAVTAPFSAVARAEYSHPLSDNLNGFVRGLVNFTGKSKTDPQNPYDDVGAYALANLYLGVRDADGAWEVTGYAKNLLNVRRVLSRERSVYSVSYAVGRSSGTALSNYRGITMTDPREFGLIARFAIGSR